LGAVLPRRRGRPGKGIRAFMRNWGVEQRGQEFTRFYTASKDDCLRIVLVNVGDRHLAEDLVAEAFTWAWMSWRKVREHPVPRAWVVRTALNAHVSWWRRRRRELTVDDPTALTGLEGSQLARSADPGLDQALVAALRLLPLRQREVITLRVFFDLDTGATAKLLGISPGTVGAHLHRALAALRAQSQSYCDQEVTS
jgi:RNA polymerase sigma factor (sigma-70 family)